MKDATSAQWQKSKAEAKRKKERKGERGRETDRKRQKEGGREKEWPINAVTKHRSSNTHPCPDRGAQHSGKIDSSSDSHPQFQIKHPGPKCFHLDLKVDLTPPYFLDMGDMGDPPKSKWQL